MHWNTPQNIIIPQSFIMQHTPSKCTCIIYNWKLYQKSYDDVYNTLNIIFLKLHAYKCLTTPICPSPRNPCHQQRPSFESVCTQLQQPPANLTSWDEKDNLIADNVNVLGAELYSSINLYLDLQEAYKESEYEEAP